MEINSATVRRSQLEIRSTTSSNLSSDLRADFQTKPNSQNTRNQNSNRNSSSGGGGGGCNNIKSILSRFCPTRDKDRSSPPTYKESDRYRKKGVSILEKQDSLELYRTANNPQYNRNDSVRNRTVSGNNRSRGLTDEQSGLYRTLPPIDENGQRNNSAYSKRRTSDNNRGYSRPNVVNNSEMSVRDERSNLQSRALPQYTDAATQTLPVEMVAKATDPVFNQPRIHSQSGSFVSPRSELNHNLTETFTQTSNGNNSTSSNNNNGTNAHCVHCCHCGSTSDHHETDIDDFYELPYQNNAEYLELLNELEKKLNARNRARVRRTIRQFELKSRPNPPTIRCCDCCCSCSCSENDDRYGSGDDTVDNDDDDDDDDDVDDESLLKKLQRRLKSKKKDEKRPPYPPLSPNRNSDILQNEQRWNQLEEKSKLGRNKRNQWQYNPKSGDWFQKNQQSRRIKSDTPRSNPKSFRSCCCTIDCKRCCCQNKRNSQ